jgi:putative SOS response-associated peptidase YedK
MCGRLAQYRVAHEYLDKITVQLPLRGGINPESIGRYNVPPQSMVQLLHLDDDGLRMEPVKWGICPVVGAGEATPSDKR